MTLALFQEMPVLEECTDQIWKPKGRKYSCGGGAGCAMVFEMLGNKIRHGCVHDNSAWLSYRADFFFFRASVKVKVAGGEKKKKRKIKIPA